MFTYLVITVYDKIECIKRCELSTVIITVHGSCQLGGCMYSMDCLVGVVRVLVFPLSSLYLSSIYLSIIYLSFYLSIYLSIYVSMSSYLSVYLYHLSMSLFVYLSTYLSICLCIYLSIYIYIHIARLLVSIINCTRRPVRTSKSHKLII